MRVIDLFLRHWERACDRKSLPKLIAEVAIREAEQSSAARSDREFLLACGLDAREADGVISEISLLTLNSDGDACWSLRRLSGVQARAASGQRLTTHFAKSYILATFTKQPPKRRRQLVKGTSGDR